jgi:HdeA/HdeB family
MMGKGTVMKKELVSVLLTCCLAACAQPPASRQQVAPAPAPAAPLPETTSAPPPRVTSEAQIAPGRWDVERVRCSDLLGAADDDRAAAAMFYYGYLAAKAGIRVIDVNQIDGNVRKVMDQCTAAPDITVPQAFRRALERSRERSD